MKIKLIDIETDTHDVQFGTCEYCFRYGTVDEPVYHFEKETGGNFSIEGYVWSWGDCDEIYVDNAILFAGYIGKQDYSEDTVYDYNWLSNQVHSYYETKEVA